MQPNIQTGNSTCLVNEKLKYAVTARHHLAVSMNINNNSNIDNKDSVGAQRDRISVFCFYAVLFGTWWSQNRNCCQNSESSLSLALSVSLYLYVVCLGVRGDSLHSKHYTQDKLDGSSCVERSVSTTPASAWLS